MKRAIRWVGAVALVLAGLAGCGGGNDGGAPATGGGAAPPPPPPSGQLGAVLTAAAAIPANDYVDQFVVGVLGAAGQRRAGRHRRAARRS